MARRVEGPVVISEKLAANHLRLFNTYGEPVEGKGEGEVLFVRSASHRNRDVPNEAVNLLKLKLDCFQTELKAVNLLKPSWLVE